MKYCLVFLVVLTIISGCSRNGIQVIENENLIVRISRDDSGIPYIENAIWRNTSEPILSGSALDFNYIRDILNIKEDDYQYTTKWQRTEDSVSTRLSCSLDFGRAEVTWNYELVKQNSILNTWIEINNFGKTLSIEWYPIYFSKVNFNRSENELDYTDALNYKRHKIILRNDSLILLHSKVYSSDTRESPGQVPIWEIKNNNSIYFNLYWCGGWQANIEQKNNWLSFKIKLPPDETQLKLSKGESIKGPKLSMTFIPDTEDITSRQKYFQQSEKYAYKQYRMPAPDNFPLVYNHWYSVRFDLTGTFLKEQVEEIPDYKFDVFVVDAGWYENKTDWIPAKDKFKPGEFEKILKSVKDKGVITGIWSCPWLVTLTNDSLKPLLEEPPYYNKFTVTYSLDLVGSNFKKRLYDHIKFLKDRYGISWWKYDQEFIGETSKHGKMKIITELQEALDTVRRSFPGLYIENCMSGGRMINGFTNTIAQSHWIRDGRKTGLVHAKTNIKEALGAAEILPLYKINRWTNRVNELTDKEVLKYYCRSAMIGDWGISTDLKKINEEQKKNILSEIKNYRELNEVKKYNLYETLNSDTSKIAGIIYYNLKRDKAYVLLFRMGDDLTLENKVTLSLINRDYNYKVTNLDSDEYYESSGDSLINNGLNIKMSPEVLSGIYKIEKE